MIKDIVNKGETASEAIVREVYEETRFYPQFFKTELANPVPLVKMVRE